MRPTKHSYFLDMAKHVATRSTCARQSVGCVLVSPDGHVLSTGYNGALPRHPHCDESGHVVRDGHCVRAIHAEVNAVAQAALHGGGLRNAIAYVTAFPCWTCYKVLVSAGIETVYFRHMYGADWRQDEDLKLYRHSFVWQVFQVD